MVTPKSKYTTENCRGVDRLDKITYYPPIVKVQLPAGLWSLWKFPRELMYELVEIGATKKDFVVVLITSNVYIEAMVRTFFPELKEKLDENLSKRQPVGGLTNKNGVELAQRTRAEIIRRMNEYGRQLPVGINSTDAEIEIL